MVASYGTVVSSQVDEDGMTLLTFADGQQARIPAVQYQILQELRAIRLILQEIGRASCRERVLSCV
jgi:hypothetical protein